MFLYHYSLLPPKSCCQTEASLLVSIFPFPFKLFKRLFLFEQAIMHILQNPKQPKDYTMKMRLFLPQLSLSLQDAINISSSSWDWRQIVHASAVVCTCVLFPTQMVTFYTLCMSWRVCASKLKDKFLQSELHFYSFSIFFFYLRVKFSLFPCKYNGLPSGIQSPIGISFLCPHHLNFFLKEVPEWNQWKENSHQVLRK